MTGQVKEEILSRFGELGVRVADGSVRFQPGLLRAREFVSEPRKFRYLDVDGDWQNLDMPARALAFTWCQVPIVYQLDDNAEPSISLIRADGAEQRQSSLVLSSASSQDLFQRSGRIRQLNITLHADKLFSD